jgi:hypothetical protein
VYVREVEMGWGIVEITQVRKGGDRAQYAAARSNVPCPAVTVGDKLLLWPSFFNRCA